MKKWLYAFFICFFCLLFCEKCFAKTVILPKGSFISVVNVREISTETYDEGDTVCFTNSDPLYFEDDVVLPAGSLFLGKVVSIREPVQGTNAAIKLDVEKVVFPSFKEQSFKAFVGKDSEEYIGGEQTEPMYYDRVPHYSELTKLGVIQYCPVNVFEFGKHTKIAPGTKLILMLVEDVPIEIE